MGCAQAQPRPGLVGTISLAALRSSACPATLLCCQTKTHAMSGIRPRSWRPQGCRWPGGGQRPDSARAAGERAATLPPAGGGAGCAHGGRRGRRAGLGGGRRGRRDLRRVARVAGRAGRAVRHLPGPGARRRRRRSAGTAAAAAAGPAAVACGRARRAVRAPRCGTTW